MRDESLPDVRATEQATHVLQLHIDNGSGYCLECAKAYSFVVPYPCTVWSWANRTLVMAGQTGRRA